ncbi:hypothetical protein [Planomonospora sphaerica]|uniref:hypothetical protein n=1 Tax=Planomonospora sphaerica TaxID=161355 RepID=UPI0012907EBC|nr:hypothetical protein [Planomonospora sphaerica]
MTPPESTQPPPRRRPWRTIALIVVVLLGIWGGFAVADTEQAPASQACTSLYAPGTREYATCAAAMDNGIVADISVSQRPRTPQQTAINTVDGFTTGAGTGSESGSETLLYCLTADGTATLTDPGGRNTCTRTITCTRQASTGGYRCVDHHGDVVDPPAALCPPSTTRNCTAATPFSTTDQIPSPPPTTAPDPALISPSPTSTSQSTPAATATSSPTPAPTTAAPAPADDPLSQAIDRAHRQGLRIWLEADLTTTWLDTSRRGTSDQFKAAVDHLAQHAAKPGVAGIKIAYDLGIRGFSSAEEIQRFISETSAALRTALRTTVPEGRRQLAVDVVVPELGCGTNTACQKGLQAKYPLLTLERVEKYVLTGGVDVVNVSSGLFATDYQTYKIPLERALTNQWLRLRMRGWDTRVLLGAREIGLAHRGDAPTTVTKAVTKTAEAAVAARVDQPVTTGGVRSVVLWTHRQVWDGATWRLTDPGLAPNPVWTSLMRRKNLGRIAITFNPHEPEKSIAEDLAVIGQVAAEVYLHAQ